MENRKKRLLAINYSYGQELNRRLLLGRESILKTIMKEVEDGKAIGSKSIHRLLDDLGHYTDSVVPTQIKDILNIAGDNLYMYLGESINWNSIDGETALDILSIHIYSVIEGEMTAFIVLLGRILSDNDGDQTLFVSDLKQLQSEINMGFEMIKKVR